jgi:hypothetical protein
MIPLAHYWGIDEVGVFVLPAIVAIVLLRWAEKKAKLRQESEGDEEKASADD